MRQFALPPDWEPGTACVLEGGRARYLSRVLRLVPGDRFPGIDSQGRRWLCELREEGLGRLVIATGPLPDGEEEASHLDDLRGGKPPPRARTGGAVGVIRGSRPPITLVQGLPKGAKMDLIVRQAAEAGVARVIPLLVLRSAARGSSPGRVERWQRIAREAIQQSGSAIPTRVEEPRELGSLAAALGAPKGRRLCLLLDAEAGAPLAQNSLHGYLTEAPDEIVLCIGPEGGFGAEESMMLSEAGFVPLRLPCAVLRTETAALYAVAAVETVLSERSSWIPRAP